MRPSKEQIDHIQSTVYKKWKSVWPAITEEAIREWELIRPVDNLIAKQAETIAILKRDLQALRLERDQWKDGAANLETELNRVNSEIQKEADAKTRLSFEEWEKNIQTILKSWRRHVLRAAHLIFSDPPKGWKWHNPDNLTPKQIGETEGWRLLLQGEDFELGTAEYNSPFGWRNSRNSDGHSTHFTYRTKNPLPAPK